MSIDKQEHAEHAHDFPFKRLRYLEFVPCEGSGHTDFDLNVCQTCGKVTAFPPSNFKLITSEVKENIIQELKAMDLELAVELLN